jgi:hypothetical protein
MIISLKSCGIAIAEVLPSSCGNCDCGLKKKLRVPSSAFKGNVVQDILGLQDILGSFTRVE